MRRGMKTKLVKEKSVAAVATAMVAYNVYQDAQITPTNEDKSCLKALVCLNLT